MRLNVRLALWHSLWVFVIVSAVLLLNYVALGNRLDEQDRHDLLFRLDQYVSAFEHGGRRAVLEMAALRQGRTETTFFMRVASAANETLFARNLDDWREFAPETLATHPVPDQDEPFWMELPSAGGFPMLIAGRRLADGTIVQIGKPTGDSQLLLQQFRRTTLLMLAIAIPISFGGGALLARRALRPLRMLTRSVREIQETAHFAMRAPVSARGDELDELAGVFNSTMERIERLLRTMRESLDNVAHDLRTPMTRLRHRAEQCLENTSDAAALREALMDCIEESDSVLATLNTLMDIAEAEAGLMADAEPVSITEVVASACDLYTEVAEDRGVTVVNEVRGTCKVSGDAVLLRRVFANLLDNAIKYTPPGGKVEITAHREGEMIAIILRDTGQGIAPGDLPKVWERLFRTDRSRTERGLGLGLSFVKAIVESAGGSVAAESELHWGSAFTVRLPAVD